MRFEDHFDATIVAPATPPGTGAVAILRLSGPAAFPIAATMTGLAPGDGPARSLRRCVVRDEKQGRIDAGLAAFFPAPRSYTGEDLVEIHLHGSPYLVDRAARAACAHGARPARPGEFTRRAFLAGKMDLTQAEAVADVIAARSAASARTALRQLSGGIAAVVAPLRERMLALLALVEASIDFPDEDDIPPVDRPQLKERVQIFASEVDRLLCSYERGRRLREGATVAIAGVANVGKSSLLNRILGEERAIVSEAPGTTRDYLSAEVDLSGLAVRLVDTAGLRSPRGAVEREGVRRSRDIVAAAELTLFLLDGSRAAGEADRRAYREVAPRPHLLVINKSDLPAAESGDGFRGPGFRAAARLSARTGAGVSDLLAQAARELLAGAQAEGEEAPLSRLRHVEAARRAQDALGRASAAVDASLPAEFVAADLREAADALGELVGEIAPEEVLDAIFDSFCIGK